MLTGKSNPPRIYLDQNAWINLSRVYYKLDTSGKLDAALKALLDATAAGRIIVPLSFNHLIEVCASGDMERRKRLATFMINISGQHAIAPASLIWQTEALDAAMRRLGINTPLLKYEKIVQRGLWAAFGTSPTLEGGEAEDRKLLDAALRSDETAIKMLSEWMTPDEGRREREQSENDAKLFETVRQEQQGTMTAAEKLRHDALQVTRDLIFPIVDAELRKLGVDPQKFRSTLKCEEDIISFAADVPSFDVMLSLGLSRDEESQRVVDRNDLRDMGFLAVAIPYCDVVVAERYFGTLGTRLGLDKKYNCAIVTDPAALPALLS